MEDRSEPGVAQSESTLVKPSFPLAARLPLDPQAAEPCRTAFEEELFIHLGARSRSCDAKVQRILCEVQVDRAPEGFPLAQGQVGFHPGPGGQIRLEVDRPGQALAHHITGGGAKADLTEVGLGRNPTAALRTVQPGGNVDGAGSRPAVPIPSAHGLCEGNQVVRGQTRPVQAAAEDPSAESKLSRPEAQEIGPDLHLFHAIRIVDRPCGSADRHRSQGQGTAFVENLSRPRREDPSRQGGSGRRTCQCRVEAEAADRERRPVEMPRSLDPPAQGDLAVKPTAEGPRRLEGSPEAAIQPGACQ